MLKRARTEIGKDGSTQHLGMTVKIYDEQNESDSLHHHHDGKECTQEFNDRDLNNIVTAA